ncbi:MAG TPA: phosphoenolpyruvate--protein phosphotransferase [Rectinemataceae bacterium]|nr:phosphoenolpyruvate--protein phosphotransferase [Rectinemataceae bacterium]
MKELRGIPASPGNAVAPAFLFFEEAELSVPAYSLEPSDVPGEWARFLAAVKKASSEVTSLRDRALEEAGADQAAIFDSHLLMLSDPDLLERIQTDLNATLRNSERVLVEIERELVERLSAASDPALRDRVADIRDVSRRILGHLLLRERLNLADLSSDVILVARDLLPSDMISMNRDRVKAIVTEIGGRTSHAAILARAFEIPAVLGVGGALGSLRSGMILAVDGDLGTVTVEPDEATLERGAAARKAAAARELELTSLRDLPAVTTDGKLVLVKANIEVPEEVAGVLTHGADGIGLFRSEFLFLGAARGHIPDEEEQYQAYSKVISSMQGRPVTIRTLDIGGDKVMPELGAQDEKNPLLGWRAIRFCLSNVALFKTQLRAILRAAVLGDARIMFPMIATADELDRALAILAEARAECVAKGQAVPESLPAGIMIEIPSAAVASDILARKADFFSIGTNDLVQYTMAVDRGNERVAYLHEPFQPAVIRLVKMTIENGQAAGISVGMCGEMAGDPRAAVLLLGLGLDEFSMSSASVPAVKRALRSVGVEEARALAAEALTLSSSAEVAEYLHAKLRS